jgi:hypothetical protein
MEKDRTNDSDNATIRLDPEDRPSPDQKLELYSAFTVGQKRAIVTMGSLAGFFSPLSSSIYLPALDTISHSLHISISQVNLTVTTYLVGP